MNDIGINEFISGINRFCNTLEDNASYFWRELVRTTENNINYKNVVEFEDGNDNKIILKGVGITLSVAKRIVFHEKHPFSLTEMTFIRDKKVISALKVYISTNDDCFLDEISESCLVDDSSWLLYKKVFDKLIRNIAAMGYLS